MNNNGSLLSPWGLAVMGLAVGCTDTVEETAPAASTQTSVQLAQVMSAPPTEAAAGLTQIAYIKASTPGDGDNFGAGGTLSGDAVALSKDGSTLAVGAPFESSGAPGAGGDQADDSVYGAGAVYVFSRLGDSWAQQAYLKASNPGLADNFGFITALSADGNTLAVAAHFESSSDSGVGADQNDDSIPQAGAVYVFSRSGDSWSQQAYIKASNTGIPVPPTCRSVRKRLPSVRRFI